MEHFIVPHLSEKGTFILFQNDGKEVKFRVTKNDFIIIGKGNFTIPEYTYIKRHYAKKF